MPSSFKNKTNKQFIYKIRYLHSNINCPLLLLNGVTTQLMDPVSRLFPLLIGKYPVCVWLRAASNIILNAQVKVHFLVELNQLSYVRTFVNFYKLTKMPKTEQVP